MNNSRAEFLFYFCWCFGVNSSIKYDGIGVEWSEDARIESFSAISALVVYLFDSLGMEKMDVKVVI